MWVEITYNPFQGLKQIITLDIERKQTVEITYNPFQGLKLNGSRLASRRRC
ncbi:hypothetical protein PL11201_680200 [Planktothrix sp. PCC 11201]|nr:hypothetical protein PL11201_680200 [Planktothrix sp. PCC 11201]